MRKPIALTTHGNSVRLTFPPVSLKYLHWGTGTEVMFIVVNDHEVRIVELEHFMREHVERQRAAAQLPATVGA